MSNQNANWVNDHTDNQVICPAMHSICNPYDSTEHQSNDVNLYIGTIKLVPSFVGCKFFYFPINEFVNVHARLVLGIENLSFCRYAQLNMKTHSWPITYFSP